MAGMVAAAAPPASLCRRVALPRAPMRRRRLTPRVTVTPSLRREESNHALKFLLLILVKLNITLQSGKTNCSQKTSRYEITATCLSISDKRELSILDKMSVLLSLGAATSYFQIDEQVVQAMRSSEESSSDEDDEILSELKEKWDAIENKSSVLFYGGGAIIAVWLSSIIVKAVDSVPVLPNILELVGLGYSGWFVYRYLLFKENREELANGFDALKKRITGNEE
uniref:Cyanobacterial aminoacyl-tRNA synthetase CAAD domain-containing protein n=1 Tax=Oryza punctata TaxID=4537 RepID=A0A0E0LV32_ORYPU